jgi:DNA mismatch repair protein MutS
MSPPQAKSAEPRVAKAEKTTPGMRQWRAVKSRHPDHLLLFRMGDFYETFHEDAVTASEVLGITLTKRGVENDKPIPLAGIPYHALESYLGRLVRAGQRVAICEQVEDPKKAKGIVRREVVRVVTPGTLVEEALLDEGRNNYLGALCRDEHGWGLAVTDLSTGALRLTVLSGRGASDQLRAELCRFAPAEVLVPAPLRAEVEAGLARTIETVLTEQPVDGFDTARAVRELTEAGLISETDGAGEARRAPALGAAGALLSYLTQTQCGRVDHLQPAVWHAVEEHMVLDAATQRGLELIESQTPGVAGATLLAVLDHTRTPLGRRRLRTWLLLPLRDVAAIDARLDSVGDMAGDFALRRRLRDHLRGFADLERILGRAATRQANARDLAALGRSLGTAPRVRETLLGAGTAGLLGELAENWTDCADLHDHLTRAVVDEPPAVTREGGMVRDGWNTELDELRALTGDTKGWIRTLQATEVERTGIQTLKVGFNRVFGYYLEVTKPNIHLVPEDWIRKQTLVNAERYITPALKEKEEVILRADERIKELELEIFEALCAEVSGQARPIQRLADQVATVDGLLSLAEAAVTGNFVRPTVTEEAGIVIREGRHPVLETLPLGGPFVPNDTVLDPAEQQILVITGPNMAGKSTHIRQVALITIMAQMGSFVPAREARIGLVDRVFTRVGATDHLARGQSTFLVEMSETAAILHHATDRSLVILDEIGRGTSTYDGLAIAWAVIEHLHATQGCRPLTLFATHYHELAELEGRLPRVKNFNVAVHEDEEEITFLYRVVPGHTDHSYGIYAAKVAGLPEEAIQRAQEILFQLECGHSPAAGGGGAEGTDYQLTLFDAATHPALERLRGIDPNQLTPVEALKVLDEIVRSLR